MVSRLIKGLFEGLLLGAAVVAVLVLGLKITTVEPWLGYALACGMGLLSGLLTGKPVWAAGAKVEAGLKAAFGALLAAGGLFALRTWFNPSIDLTLLRAGSGPLGDLPAANLPLIAAALGALFEVDNAAGSGTAGGTRVAESRSASADAEDDGAELTEERSRRGASRGD